MGDCYITRTAMNQHPMVCGFVSRYLCVSPADQGLVWRAWELVHLKRYYYDLFWLKIRHIQAKECGLTFDPNIHDLIQKLGQK